MYNVIKQLERIERVDQLIRLEATGTPLELASRLRISRTQLHRIINIMKMLNAPIVYDDKIRSYRYKTIVGCQFGFYTKKLETRKINTLIKENRV
ncbi:DNA-binding protein [Aquimarina algiphila]|uniref:DNA-binding protein n=1 Tax=Aquimarina algiphila TaxID=2047982 RepID=A0A554VEH5_9FLAO|nr:DNA-binding protein [Aquimarina algiphila]TSE05422.1 DNA-binding protein [Aquimarina algiphila]